MEFSRPDLFYLFLSLVLLIFVYVLYSKWRRSLIESIFNTKTLNKVMPGFSYNMKFIHFFLRVCAIILLIIAIVGPKIGTKLNTIKREGVDVVFLLDVSKSMLVEDVAPNRLLKSLKILSTAIDNLISDRVGVIVYAGKAYPLMPLSFDYSMAKLLITTIDTDIVPSQGTDVLSAIALAESFFNQADRNKILFIISDGEDHQIDYNKELEFSNDNNFIVSTLNIGTTSGGPIPLKIDGSINYKKDKNGKVVISKSNNSTLKAIASIGNGSFIKTVDTDDAVEFISDNLKSLDKTLQEEEVFSDYESQFQWFLFFALFFILLDVILSEKKISLISNLIKE
jgi:Ca-activated chloride channel family protein